MSEYLGDFRHGRAVAQHPDRQAMPKKVGGAVIRGVYFGTGERPPYNTADGGRPDLSA